MSIMIVNNTNTICLYKMATDGNKRSETDSIRLLNVNNRTRIIVIKLLVNYRIKIIITNIFLRDLLQGGILIVPLIL